MRDIIVIAGNKKEFDDFRQFYINHRVHWRHKNNITSMKGVEIRHIVASYQLRGYKFSKDSELVKVGTYYNLPEEVVKDIEVQFELRKEK